MAPRALAVLAAACLLFPTTASPQVPLERPAAALWHAGTDAWYVANLGGNAGAPQGWIARLDRRDKRAQPRWLTGLRAPRAMVADDLIYVADTDEVVVVDAARAAIVRRHKVPGARALAGIAIGDGDVFVSDPAAGSIHRVSKDGRVSLVRKNLSGPAGLTFDGGLVTVACHGRIRDAKTLSPTSAGEVVVLDLGKGTSKAVGSTNVGHPWSLVKLGDAYVVGDPVDGAVRILSQTGEVTVIRKDLKGCGGLGLDPKRRLVAVPETNTNNVLFLTVP